MALLFVDPFEGYTTAPNMADRGWDVAGGSLVAGRFSPGLAWFVDVDPDNAKRAFPASGTKVLVQFAIQWVAHTAASEFLRLFNSSGADRVLELHITAANALQVKNAAGAVVHTSAAALLPSLVWHSICVEAEVGSAAGTVKIWVNQTAAETPVINLAGIDLTDGSAAGCDMLQFVITPALGQANYSVCQLLIYDNTGGSFNTFVGDKRQFCLLPTSDSAVEWQRNGGATNFSRVDDPLTTTHDGDTTYVFVDGGEGGGPLDLYGWANLPAGVVGIEAVVGELIVKKSDGGAPPLQDGLRFTWDDGVQLLGSPDVTGLTTNYFAYQWMTYLDPSGDPWVAAAVDAILGGPDIAAPV